MLGEIGKENGDIGLERLLTSDNQVQRIAGRFVATGIPESIESFCRAEAARETEPIDLLQGLATTLAAIFASRIAVSLRVEPPKRFYEDMGNMMGTLFKDSIRFAVMERFGRKGDE